MKERLKQEYNRKLRMILKSELNARNNITAIGALAVPVLSYSFGITRDNKFQKNFCICDEYVINLFVCIYEVRKGT